MGQRQKRLTGISKERCAPKKYGRERGVKGILWMHTTQLTSQMLVKQKPQCSATAVVVLLAMVIGKLNLLACCTCDKYGATVF